MKTEEENRTALQDIRTENGAAEEAREHGMCKDELRALFPDAFEGGNWPMRPVTRALRPRSRPTVSKDYAA